MSTNNKFEIAIPGVKRDKINLTVARVNGENRIYIDVDDCDRYPGGWSDAFVLFPTVDVDNITTKLEDGILSIDLPLKQEAQPKRLTIG